MLISPPGAIAATLPEGRVGIAPHSLRAVTPEDVARVAAQYLRPENRTVGWFVPEGHGAGATSDYRASTIDLAPTLAPLFGELLRRPQVLRRELEVVRSVLQVAEVVALEGIDGGTKRELGESARTLSTPFGMGGLR